MAIAARPIWHRPTSCRQRLAHLGVAPFLDADVTVGLENEFQVAVIGRPTEVDLVQTILGSRYYRNLTRRTGRGDLDASTLNELDALLDEPREGAWENSWGRFPRRHLGERAAALLAIDLLADKSRPEGPQRGDLDRFFFVQGGEEWLRIPVSYLLKLALAEAVDQGQGAATILDQAADHIMAHLICDNAAARDNTGETFLQPQQNQTLTKAQQRSAMLPSANEIVSGPAGNA